MSVPTLTSPSRIPFLFFFHYFSAKILHPHNSRVLAHAREYESYGIVRRLTGMWLRDRKGVFSAGLDRCKSAKMLLGDSTYGTGYNVAYLTYRTKYCDAHTDRPKRSLHALRLSQGKDCHELSFFGLSRRQPLSDSWNAGSGGVGLVWELSQRETSNSSGPATEPLTLLCIIMSLIFVDRYPCRHSAN